MHAHIDCQVRQFRLVLYKMNESDDSSHIVHIYFRFRLPFSSFSPIRHCVYLFMLRVRLRILISHG